jgi:cytochrome oxidase Cu insertion factor (SCO1/SenC/PrrC family)
VFAPVRCACGTSSARTSSGLTGGVAVEAAASFEVASVVHCAVAGPSGLRPGKLTGYPRAVAANRLLVAAVAALLAAAGLGLYVALRPGSGSGSAERPAAATWAVGEKAAPDFRLTDEYGKAVSIGGLRGRDVIVTFVDPHCTTFCPREAIVLNDAVSSLPAADRPAIVAVNVNPPVSRPAELRREARRFKWLPQWRWATGTRAQLESVWADYAIQVVPAKDDIGHTEAAYLVDRNGDQRALFVWPFSADAIADGLKRLR